jgi:hypothetical protein
MLKCTLSMPRCTLSPRRRHYLANYSIDVLKSVPATHNVLLEKISALLLISMAHPPAGYRPAPPGPVFRSVRDPDLNERKEVIVLVTGCVSHEWLAGGHCAACLGYGPSRRRVGCNLKEWMLDLNKRVPKEPSCIFTHLDKS